MKKILVAGLALSLMACTEKNIEPAVTPTANTSQTTSTGCDVFKECKTPEEKTELYLSLLNAADSPFQKITMEEAVSIFSEQKDEYLFLGFETCPWCLDAMPILNDVAKELQKTIKYVDVRPGGIKENDLRQDSNPDYVALQQYLGNLTNDGTDRIYVPLFVVIRNGEIKAYQTELDYDASEVDITVEQQDQYRDIYIKLLSE